MMSFPLGAILMAIVLAFAFGQSSLGAFLNPHSLSLVFGGTFAVLGLSTPMPEIINLARCLLGFKKNTFSEKEVFADLNALIRRRDAKTSSQHPLVIYAQDLWDKGVESQMLMALLGRKMEDLGSASEKSVATLRNLAKYPPALGMTGTVIGLVSLFAHLTPENRQGLGPLLAMAMTATFYGLILANAVLMPLADRLYVNHLAETRMNEQVFKILLLIHQEEAPKVIEDELHAASAA